MVLRRFDNSPILRRRTNMEVLFYETLVFKRKKKVIIVNLFPATEEIIRHWHLQGLAQHRMDAKYINTINTYIQRLRKGIMFDKSPKFFNYRGKKFTIDEIKGAINNFATAALCNNFEPKSKKHLLATRIPDFILNEYVWLPDGSRGSSYFLQYVHTRPKRIIAEDEITIQDNYPQITAGYKGWFKRFVLGGTGGNFSIRDENHFRTASQKTHEYYVKNRSKFVPEMNITEASLAKLVCESLQEGCGNKPYLIQPSWISSNTTYERRLPAFLSFQGVISTDDGQYNMYSGGA